MFTLAQDPETRGEPAHDEAHEPGTFRFELATLSDRGAERPNNEDSCGEYVESASSALWMVADGIGGYEGGEIASRTAVDATIEAFRASPPSWGGSKRLYRAVQQANIEIYDRAIVVPELRNMGTTITAAAVEHGTLCVAHVGDTRLYLVRGDRISQLSKDHTVAAERVRLGLISAEQARSDAHRGTLTRRLGGELIASIDRFSLQLERHDVVLICSDGLYNVLVDRELSELTRAPVETACRELVAAAIARGAPDNVTAAVFRVTEAAPPRPPVRGWRAHLSRWLSR